MKLSGRLAALAASWRAEWAPPALPPWARALTALLLGLALAALLAQLAVYVHFAGALLRFPFDYDQGEGFELYDTLLHAQGRWPYQDSQVFPFYTSIYPPLFHLLTVPLVWAFGPALWTGRLVSFTASLIAAGAIAWAVRRETGRPGLAALCGLAFLASNYTFAIGPLFRQHMTMVMFETLAIVTLASFTFPARPERPGAWRALANPRLLAGLGLLLAAGFAKQLALATVLAALGYLFLRGPRRALLAGAALAVVAGALYAAIDWATAGWWTVSIIRANINDFDLPQMLGFYREWLELHAVLAAAALLYLGHEVYRSRLSAYGLWFAAAVANGALSGKFGAGESYFITATAAACVLAGLAAGRAATWAAGRAGRWPLAVALAVPVLCLAQTRLTLHTYTEGPVYGPVARLLGVADNSGRGYYDSQGYTQLGPRPTRADHEAGYTIVARVRQVNGPVFSEEAAFLLVAGKPVVTNPFVQLVMYRAGLFDPTEEIALIRQRAFGLVIFRAQFYPPPVLEAIGQHYQPVTEVQMNGFTYRLLEPRP